MRAAAIGLLMLCLGSTGCGTVCNVLGPRQYPHAYGGFEYDCLAMRATWTRSDNGDTKTKRLAESLLFTTLIAIDMPLSLAGDAVTLPAVLLQSGFSNAAWGFRFDGMPAVTVLPPPTIPAETRSTAEPEPIAD